MRRGASQIVDGEGQDRGEIDVVGVEERANAFGIVVRDILGRIRLDGLTRPVGAAESRVQGGEGEVGCKWTSYGQDLYYIPREGGYLQFRLSVAD